MHHFHFSKYQVSNLIIIFILLLLPYYLFDGKLYIGGDDTRLMYSYPYEYLKNATLYSWNHFSNFGWNFPAQSFIPFLSIWIVFDNILNSKIIISYLAFSLPLILGFIYFQKLIKEFVVKSERYKLQIFGGGLFYVFSPIIAYQLLFIFLTSAWLICLLPIIFYYFIKYLKTSEIIYLIKSTLIFTFLSFVTLSVPWILGFIFPFIVVTIILSFLFSKKEITTFIKKFIIFFGVLALSQAFWLLGYLMTYIRVSSNSFAAKVFSQGFQDTFTPTITSTAKGVIFFPLLNLINRQIAVDFNWDIKNIFFNFYDKILLLNFIFLVVIFFGVVNLKKYLNTNEKRIYLIFFTAFILLLYLITVNIGPLKDLFIYMRHLPAFTMFRNFYDKFSLGYVFCFSTVVAFGLIIIKRKFENSKNIPIVLTIVFIVVVFINIIPLKKVVNAPIWQSGQVYKNIIIPGEYLKFMSNVGKTISPNNNILSVPFGSAAYTVIKDEDSNSVYAGTSPVILFSGVNDISGHLSFNFTKEADTVDRLIIERKYEDFRKILFDHNINYLILTKNTPPQLIDSYLFNRDLFEKQDDKFIKSIVDKKILSSSTEKFELYELKDQNSLISSNNLYFQRINPSKYRIYIKKLKKPQKISFNDSFHEGWSLYLIRNPDVSFCKKNIYFEKTQTTECIGNDVFSQNEDVPYMFKKNIFGNTHNIGNNFSNTWILDKESIINNYDSNYYKLNEDGSIDIELILYFKPQSNFLLGILVSALTFISLFLLWIKFKKIKI